MRFLKVGAVIFGALVITTLGISAADTFSGNAGSLLSQLSGDEESTCPAGMIEVVVGQSFSCVDLFEVSPSGTCVSKSPKTAQETQENINDLECFPESKAEGDPWTYVSRAQAQVLCARVGKRLPTSDEWYTFSVGTVDLSRVCNNDSAAASLTGAHEQCISAAGVYDAVGNVWEWTSDDVFDGMYKNRKLPTEGYVAQVDASGVATLTDSSPSQEFGDDYFWDNPEGIYGVLRGGFFGSGDDAGLYATQAKTVPTTAAVAVGFRCVR